MNNSTIVAGCLIGLAVMVYVWQSDKPNSPSLCETKVIELEAELRGIEKGLMSK